VVTVALRWPHAGGVEGFSQTITGDHLALAAQGLLALAGFLSVLAAWNYLRVVGEDHGEYYALLLTAVFGGMIMVGAVDMIMLFLGLEILSISIYTLAGFLRRRLESGESALKFSFWALFPPFSALWHVADLRRDRHAALRGDRRETGPGRGRAAAEGRTGAAAGRLRLQDRRVSLPRLTPDVYQGAPARSPVLWPRR
jgi:hypothetical protein